MVLNFLNTYFNKDSAITAFCVNVFFYKNALDL